MWARVSVVTRQVTRQWGQAGVSASAWRWARLVLALEPAESAMGLPVDQVDLMRDDLGRSTMVQ